MRAPSLITVLVGTLLFGCVEKDSSDSPDGDISAESFEEGEEWNEEGWDEEEEEWNEDDWGEESEGDWNEGDWDEGDWDEESEEWDEDDWNEEGHDGWIEYCESFMQYVEILYDACLAGEEQACEELESEEVQYTWADCEEVLEEMEHWDEESEGDWNEEWGEGDWDEESEDEWSEETDIDECEYLYLNCIDAGVSEELCLQVMEECYAAVSCEDSFYQCLDAGTPLDDCIAQYEECEE